MKIIHLFIVLGCLALAGADAEAVLVVNLIGQPTVAINGAGQSLNYQPVSMKTNVIRGVTNDTTVLKSTTTNFTINASSLLALLANSFNTNFPAGTQLLLAGGQGFYSLVVSDETGTNISSLPVHTVLNPVGWALIRSGRRMEVSTNGVFSVGTDSEVFSTAISFEYNDSGMDTTGDGTHSTFSWNGIIEAKASRNAATGIATENVTMTLTGAGQVRNQPSSVFTGTIRAKLSGKSPDA